MQVRQQTILELLVKEYIRTAEPVGSQILVQNYKLDLSPATVRNEMSELEEQGYLYQPHTSAGRAPTDKGYRFFVNKVVYEIPKQNRQERVEINVKKRMGGFGKNDSHQLVKEISKIMSDFSRNVGICGFLEEEDFYASGLSNLFKEPEFLKNEETPDFLEVFDSLDKEIEKMFSRIENEVQVFIGKENIIDAFDDMSLVVSRCNAKHSRKGVVGILGPRRMNYARNIALVDAVRDLIHEF